MTPDRTLLASPALESRLFPATPLAPGCSLGTSVLPPLLRPDAELSVLDISEYFGETSGGVRTYLLHKARYVHSREHLRQVILVPGRHDAVTESEGVRCYRLRGPSIPTRKPYRFMLATRSTERIVRHERPGLVEIGSAWIAPWLVRRAGRGDAVPAVWFYHDNFPRVLAPAADHQAPGRWTRAGLAWRYARLVSRSCRATLASTDFMARELERHGVERVTRVSLGVDLDRFNPERRYRREETRREHGLPDGPLALFVGRIALEKRIDLILDAWPAIERRTGARLALVGAGPDVDRFRARPGADRVYWLPFQRDRDRLADLIAAADLVVSATTTETFGLAALEALASGTPVVAADVGGIAEHVVRSGAGAVFPSGDRDGLGDAAATVLQGDPAALGARGRRHAEAHHAWPVVLDRIFEVYRQVIAK